MNNQLFTPRTKAGAALRKRMFISKEDAAKIQRGKAWDAVIKDINTDRSYHVIGCSCSLPGCFCDAFIASFP